MDKSVLLVKMQNLTNVDAVFFTNTSPSMSSVVSSCNVQVHVKKNILGEPNIKRKPRTAFFQGREDDEKRHMQHATNQRSKVQIHEDGVKKE